MPQLDKVSILATVFWLSISYVVLYWILSFFMLPQLKRVIRFRTLVFDNLFELNVKRWLKFKTFSHDLFFFFMPYKFLNFSWLSDNKFWYGYFFSFVFLFVYFLFKFFYFLYCFLLQVVSWKVVNKKMWLTFGKFLLNGFKVRFFLLKFSRFSRNSFTLKKN